MLTGSSEGGTLTERKERQKGRRDKVKQGIMEGGMNVGDEGVCMQNSRGGKWRRRQC